MFLIAAKTLAKQVSKADLLNGTIYPDLNNILDISLQIAEQVAAYVFEQGLNRSPQPADIKKVLQNMMYNPRYWLAVTSMHGIGAGVVAGTPENFVTLNKPILRIPATSSDSTQAIDSDTNPPV